MHALWAQESIAHTPTGCQLEITSCVIIEQSLKPLCLFNHHQKCLLANSNDLLYTNTYSRLCKSFDSPILKGVPSKIFFIFVISLLSFCSPEMAPTLVATPLPLEWRCTSLQIYLETPKHLWNQPCIAYFRSKLPSI